MTRCLPETSFQHNGRRDLNISFSAMDLPPIINQQVLQDHALWQKYRQSRPFIKDRKYSKLFPQLSVISCFCLFNHMQIFIQLCRFWKRDPIDSRKHLILFAASPIGPGHRQQFDRFDLAHIRNMRPCAKFLIFTLLIEADRLCIMQFLNQLKFIHFTCVRHKTDRFFS